MLPVVSACAGNVFLDHVSRWFSHNAPSLPLRTFNVVPQGCGLEGSPASAYVFSGNEHPSRVLGLVNEGLFQASGFVLGVVDRGLLIAPLIVSIVAEKRVFGYWLGVVTVNRETREFQNWCILIQLSAIHHSRYKWLRCCPLVCTIFMRW